MVGCPNLLVFVHVLIQVNISGVCVLSSFTSQLSSSRVMSQCAQVFYLSPNSGACVCVCVFVFCEFLCLGPCTVFVGGTEPCSIMCLEK